MQRHLLLNQPIDKFILFVSLHAKRKEKKTKTKQNQIQKQNNKQKTKKNTFFIKSNSFNRYCTTNQKLTGFVLYSKVMNAFFENDMQKIGQETPKKILKLK